MLEGVRELLMQMKDSATLPWELYRAFMLQSAFFEEDFSCSASEVLRDDCAIGRGNPDWSASLDRFRVRLNTITEVQVPLLL